MGRDIRYWVALWLWLTFFFVLLCHDLPRTKNVRLGVFSFSLQRWHIHPCCSLSRHTERGIGTARGQREQRWCDQAGRSEYTNKDITRIHTKLCTKRIIEEDKEDSGVLFLTICSFTCLSVLAPLRLPWNRKLLLWKESSHLTLISRLILQSLFKKMMCKRILQHVYSY